MRALFMFVALFVCACGSPPDALTVAEHACRLHVLAVVDSGVCDDVADLTDCPEYERAMSDCRALLDAATGPHD